MEIREALRDLMASNNGESYSEDACAVLNRAFSTLHAVPAFTRNSAEFRTESRSPLRTFVGVLLQHVFIARIRGEFDRYKACRNQECRAAFYDASRNRSGQWCDMAVCGAAHKMREYRRRLKMKGE